MGGCNPTTLLPPRSNGFDVFAPASSTTHIRRGRAVWPDERFTVTVPSEPFDTFQNTAPRAGVKALVHPPGVTKLGLAEAGTTTAATNTSPDLGAEPSVAEMLVPLALAFLVWTSEMPPDGGGGEPPPIVYETASMSPMYASSPIRSAPTVSGSEFAIDPIVTAFR